MGCRLKAIICQIGLRRMYCEVEEVLYEFEFGIGDCLVRGFDRINGIYRIG
jgi:hypothetical protein